MTLSNAISEFIKEVSATKAKQTAAAYASDLRRMAKHAKIDTVLHFTAGLVRSYLEWESYQNARPATLHRKQAAIRSFARWCVRNRILAEDPTAGMGVIPRPDLVPRPFSRDEIRRLWALALEDDQERLFHALLFFTGLRVTPICAIRLGDIDTDPPTIRVVVKGSRVQVIHLHPTVASLVTSYVLARTDLKPSTPLLHYANGKPWRRKHAVQVTRRWGVAAKVHDCTPHRFRHTFGTRLLETTGDLRIVQEAMGHRDIKSTVGYTRVTQERLRGAIGSLTWNDEEPRS